jgi:hypothetical protein
MTWAEAHGRRSGRDWAALPLTLGIGVLVLALWLLSAGRAECDLPWLARNRPGGTGRFREQAGIAPAAG